MKVEYVPTAFIQQQWPLVERHLAAALEHAHGDLTIDQLRADLSANRMALYKFSLDGELKGAAAVSFQNQRNARVAFVTAVGGSGLTNESLRVQFFDLLRKNGATKVAGAMRESMVRLAGRMGLKKKYVIAEVDL